jgi:hypothetical protein
MTLSRLSQNVQWPKVVVSTIALIFLRLICTAPDACAGSKTKFLALGTVQLSRTTCSLPGCDAPKGHCECVSWDGGEAQVSGLGTIKEMDIGFLINLDSCVEEPGPVAYNFNLSAGTVCESLDEFSYKATFQTQPSLAGSTIKDSGTVPSNGEFLGIAPIPPDGHIQFFMR